MELYSIPGGFLPDILLFAQARILVWFDGTIIVLMFSLCLVALHGD